MCSEQDVKDGVPKAIQFGIMSPEEIIDISRVHVDSQDFFESSNEPKKGGLLDYRMGTIDRGSSCQTCFGKNKECQGHFGHITFPRRIFSWGFIQDILDVLRCVCPHCSRVIISRRDKQWKRLMAINNPQLRIKTLATRIAPKINKCYYPPAKKEDMPEGCGKMLAVYKYGDNIRIVAEFPVVYPEFPGEGKFNITAEKVYEIFSRIDEKDYEILGFDGVNTKPQWMILKHLPVLPVTMRPSNRSNAAARTENETTKMLTEIQHASDILRQSMEEYEKIQRDEGMNPTRKTKELEKANKDVMDKTQMLQMLTALYFDTKSVDKQQKFFTKGNRLKRKGLFQQLSYKEGLLRGNLMGKRQDFTARTVITPDPFLGINEVAIPYSIAKTLTKKEVVNRFNIKLLETLVQNGPYEVDGANFVITEDGKRHDLRHITPASLLPLRYGMKVERHLRNGDQVTFNRQPSLHKQSYMTHIVRVMPYSTFRMNESTTTPYNADFDGDEMNVQDDQRKESEVEALELMLVEKNFLSPANGKPCMGLVQDKLLSTRLITMRDEFFTREQVMQIIGFTKHWDGKIPQPCILKPKTLWSGKQILSCVMPKINYTNYCIDFPESERGKDVNGLSIEDLSPTDTKVIIRGGDILVGHMDKNTLGNSAKSIIHVILKDFGTTLNREILEDIQSMMMEYMAIRGFTIGNGDMQVDKNVRRKVKEALDEIEKHSIEWKKKNVTIAEYETVISKMLQDARSKVSKDIISNIPRNNNLSLILSAGTKGSSTNFSQIVSCVGQNTVEGKRIPYSFTNRVGPHTTQFDDSPNVKGFASNCLMNGLHPFEYFLYTMSGREGLIDTAVKTSETGYMQRRLCKAAEDLCVQYDGTVRNSGGNVIQFAYGEDGFDPCCSEFHPYELGNMSKSDFEKKYLWEDEKGCDVLLMERSRLEKDFEFVRQNSEIFTTFTTPVHLYRLVENLPHKNEAANMMEAEEIVKEVIQLQIQLWRLIPQVEYPWESKFAFLLRSVFASKRVVKEFKIDRKNWKWLTNKIERMFQKALSQPGDMVGIIAGQSIGEPATQMTLNVFHNIAVSEKNIPLGVPRLKEIINNAKTTKNPSMTIFLKESVNKNREFVEKFARSLRALYFSDICMGETIWYDPEMNQTVIEEDIDLVKRFVQVPDFIEENTNIRYSEYVLRFVMNGSKMQDENITIETVIKALRNVYDRNLHLEYCSELAEKCIIRARIIQDKKSVSRPGEDYFMLLEVCKFIKKNVTIFRIDGIRKTFVKEYRSSGEYIIETEGSNLQEVIGNIFVDHKRTISNDINEIAKVIGYEAARNSIINEITQVLKFYGIHIDKRHLSLLADLMCNREIIMGTTRHGMNRIDRGPLMKASFEETPEVLHEAARFHQMDRLKGVSEAIMTGILPPIGTGKVSLFLDVGKVIKCKDVIPTEDQVRGTVTPTIDYDSNTTSVLDMIESFRSEGVMDDLDHFLDKKDSALIPMEYNVQSKDEENTNWRPPSPDQDIL